MRVALFGGTGFVGSYIVDQLIDKEHIPRMLVRNGSIEKSLSRDKCEIVNGDITDGDAIREVITGADAVIYTIGIIREFASKGITYEKLHFEGAIRCMDIAIEMEVKRFILMSANGVCPSGTGYQKTKWMSEQYLKNTDLEWTIFRPSLIFGDPRGHDRPEFCTQLKKDLINLPFPAPLFHEGLLPFNAGSFTMSPIHVKTVADIFVSSIDKDNHYSETIELGGETELTWKEIIKIISNACGKKKWALPAPVIAVKTVAAIFDRFSWFPVTKDQLTMLVEGNTCDSTNYFSDNNLKPLQFNIENLSYLKTP
jgi:NADH dehydrogenase|tara:strand:+ start:2837 stop:3769 length:933 start_codon:yes stop_codon:yes gene_type:complete